ncbi:MAG: hypothetical protein IT292_06335 [Deltaproteobacteria bacterium]|nr:hypothetical protein [Deltaproteobacteria bacterium]
MKIISSGLLLKWKLVFKVAPIIAVVVCTKLLVHHAGWEIISLSPLFTALVSANIFLIGFLISGVLSDYKESEKIPGDIAASLETLADEAIIIYKSKRAKVALDYLAYLAQFSHSLLQWFYKKERTEAVMQKLSHFNEFFLAFEHLTQANFIARLKQEQSFIRKTINRAHAIRETSFLQAGYLIAELITLFLVLGLVFIKISPYYESIFFVAFVSFILVYMILLIHDLDNPFGYAEKDTQVEDVSLKLLVDADRRLIALAQSFPSTDKHVFSPARPVANE